MPETPCPRRGAWVRPCRFEARYDEGAARPLTDAEADALELSARDTVGYVRPIEGGIKATRPRIYIRDVCTTCGRTVERSRDGGDDAGFSGAQEGRP